MSCFKKIAFFSFFFTLFGALIIQNIFFLPSSSWYRLVPSVFADEDGEEEDEDEEEDEENRKTSTSNTAPKTQKIIQNVTEYKPVTKTVIVTEEAYQKDTDGDELVDAIDPDPLKHQSEYFTDTDDDGVPNALDQHHDEDDFAYLDFETDENENGIIDSYEQNQ